MLLPVASMGCLTVLACAGRPAASVRRLESADPSKRMLAIVELAELNGQTPHRDEPGASGSIIPLLVDRLEDEDEGVRFFAIVALQKLTGTRLGYRYRDSVHLRRYAVQRWRRYTATAPTELRASGPGSP